MHQTLSKKLIFTLCGLITMLPSMAIAQTAATDSTSGDTLQAPVTPSSPVSFTLLVNVTNADNSRFLGDVKINFSKYPKTSEYAPDLIQGPITVPDPPPPGGFKIEKVKANQYEIIAERKGYKIYDEVVSISSEKTYSELSIKMTPIVGTPTVNENDLTSYQNNLNNYFASRYGTNTNQFPYTNNNPYSTTNNGSVYNPYNNYPQGTYNTGGITYNPNTGTYTNTGTYNPNAGTYNPNTGTYNPNTGTYNNTQYGTGPYGNGQFPYQQTYNTYANEQFIIPLVININQSSSYSVNQLTVEINDLGYAGNTSNPSYNTLNNRITLTPQNTSSYTANPFSQVQTLYGCLQPNRNYQIIVRQGINFSNIQTSTAEPVASNFTAPGAAYAERINVTPPGSYANVVQIAAEVIPQSNLGVFPIRCPNTSYAYTGTNGPTTFADSQIYFSNLSNYIIQRMPGTGGYYLVSKTNQSDFRQLSFVDRGDGLGGLVFFPATQTAYNQQPPTNSQWYFTGYTRTSNDDIRFLPEVFTKTPMTPSDYARIMNKTVTSMFTQLPTATS